MDVIPVELPKNDCMNVSIPNVEVYPKIAGVTVHNDLTGRNAADQHPISAITGLQSKLDGKQPAGNYLTAADLQSAVNTALTQAKASGEFDGEDGSDGTDGRSPTIDVSEIENGHRVFITDATGEKHFDVLDAAGENNCIVATESGDCIVLTDSAEKPLRRLTLYGKTTQDGTPSPTNPIPLVSAGGSGNIVTMVQGKNLVNFPNVAETTTKGVTVSCNGGVITATGTAEETVNTSKIISSTLHLPAGEYTVSSNLTGTGGYASLRIMGADGTSTYKNANKGNLTLRFTLDGTEQYVQVYAQYATGEVNSELRIQIESGNTATVYDSYKDGGSVAVSTPNGLPGVPVTSGGNYTDENGQQWLCDEVDFERGIYVQRLTPFQITELSSISIVSTRTNDDYVTFEVGSGLAPSTNYSKVFALSSHFEHVLSTSYLGTLECAYLRTGNTKPYFISVAKTRCSTVEEFREWAINENVMFMYIVAEPIETPLTTAEIAAYKALHTNKPMTTILNDGGAGISVSYVADTKAYIDNKFAALESAILSTGGNV